MQLIIIHVSKEDLWIKIFLNIFKLSPNINSIFDLSTCDGINFHVSPNNKNEMRLKIDGYKFPPILRDLFYQQYKLSNPFFTNHKFIVTKLRNVLKKDMNNIDLFISKWHKLHSTRYTDWEGNSIE